MTTTTTPATFKMALAKVWHDLEHGYAEYQIDAEESALGLSALHRVVNQIALLEGREPDAVRKELGCLYEWEQNTMSKTIIADMLRGTVDHKPEAVWLAKELLVQIETVAEIWEKTR